MPSEKADSRRTGRPETAELGLRYAADGVPVVLIVVVDIGVATIEVQVVRVVTIVGGRRPVVAVGATIVELAIVVVAGVNAKEYNTIVK